ncbi:hypothetical protein [Methanobrevibacter sp. DSM 116169]|uniref:hypothetical protein n=1 Tax=Methanobrevibacter sp. DSM 116169 TaxID=3242727 RepID=UPI0038FC8614
MHGLLFNIKSDKEKYGGYEFKLDYKLIFKSPNKEWDDDIANSFFVNGVKNGSPEEVKGDCGNADPKLYDEFYDNLSKLYNSKELEEVASKMDARETHVFKTEGVILFCNGEMTT